MKIAILGLGYVGMTAAACLASRGHQVVGVDPNRTKVETVTNGRAPISEPGLDNLVADARKNQLLRAITSIDDTVAQCELAIVCVGTPSSADGAHDMSAISDVSRQLAELLRTYPNSKMTVAYRSTVRPGTMEQVIRPIFDTLLGNSRDRVELVYNPEFLRESTAIHDFFNPPKIVVGTEDGQPNAAMDLMNEGLEAPVFYVRYRESEITKLVDNTFHAVKISFANEIGRICARNGVSATEVHRIFVSDTKLNISPYYLRPGGAFGGSCLPKDVRALQHLSRISGSNTHLIDSLLPSNDAHKMFLHELATTGLPYGARVLMIGLAFKDKSDDLRESPNIDLARMLITAGYQLSIFDPFVAPENLLGQNLGVLSNSPFIRDLLISQQEAEASQWDLVIDTRSIADRYSLASGRVIDVNKLS